MLLFVLWYIYCVIICCILLGYKFFVLYLLCYNWCCVELCCVIFVVFYCVMLNCIVLYCLMLCCFAVRVMSSNFACRQVFTIRQDSQVTIILNAGNVTKLSKESRIPGTMQVWCKINSDIFCTQKIPSKLLSQLQFDNNRASAES